jgi:8-oxo-dGTP diphosphatase
MPQKPKSAAPRRLKVLAAVMEKDGRILIARRKSTDRFGGQWEFPGGKLEPGETPEQCLERELTEEFGIASRSGRLLGSAKADSPEYSIRLDAYEAFHLAGEFELREHDEIRWVLPSELDGYDLTEPDRKLLGQIMKKRGQRPR